MKTAKISSSPRSHAFTLIEVLAVVGILTIVVAGAAPVISSTIKASRITQAASLVQAVLHEAQSLALTFSNDFEVRLLAAQPNDPNSRDAIQIFTLVDAEAATSEASIFQPSGTPEYLPQGVVFCRNESFSTLLNRDNGEQHPDSTKGGSVLAAIRFFADGSTDLSEGVAWHVTVVDSADERATQLPKNYATIQLDPITGSLTVFRPE